MRLNTAAYHTNSDRIHYIVDNCTQSYEFMFCIYEALATLLKVMLFKTKSEKAYYSSKFVMSKSMSIYISFSKSLTLNILTLYL